MDINEVLHSYSFVSSLSVNEGDILEAKHWGKICLNGPEETIRSLSLHPHPSLGNIGNVITGEMQNLDNYLQRKRFSPEQRQGIFTAVKDAFQCSVIELLKTYKGDINEDFIEEKYKRCWNLLSAAVGTNLDLVARYLLKDMNADPKHIVPGTGPIYYYCQYHFQVQYLGEIEECPPGYVPLMILLFDKIENESYIRTKDFAIGSLRDQRGANLVFYATKWSSNEHFSYIQSVANIHHLNRFGETAISAAATDKRAEFITKLIQAGVKPTYKDRRAVQKMMPEYILPE